MRLTPDVSNAPVCLRGMVACVVDDSPRFHLQALRWFATLTRCAGVSTSELTVFDAGHGPESDVLAHLRRRDVRVQRIRPFDKRSSHCNKIPALIATTVEASGVVALSDCDLVFLADPRTLLRDPQALHAKPVDAANPPLAVLARVLAAHGLPLGETDSLPLFPGETTCLGNANGGLYVGDASVLRTLAVDWAREALWLLEHRELLDSWAIYVDQISMLLALRAGRRRFWPLPIGANLPTHIASVRDIPAAAIGPLLGIHYHDQVTPQGLLMRTGVAHVDVAVDQANDAIRAEFGQFFPNATFWAWRYGRDPELGSGIGSRGVSLQQKRDLVRLAAAGVSPNSTLDVGCGDGAVVTGLALARYLGLDLAPNAGGQLRDGKVVACRSIEMADSADLTLCLDVGIHESDPRAWEQLVARVVASARAMALISGYERPPPAPSPMVHFHGPLSEVLARCARRQWALPLREDQGVVTWAVLVEPTKRHLRDLQRETVAQLPDGLLLGAELAALLACAWRTTGFFPDHLPRVWEYPVVLRLLRERVPAGGSVLDIGAGVNPLVPLLCTLGYQVTTVDPGRAVDSLESLEHSNEWGYLDYARLGLDVKSVHGTLTDVPDGETYDAIISISVIEHLKAVDRRALLLEMKSRSRGSGLLVLTVDIASGSHTLWNRSEGVRVDPVEEHGHWDDLVAEVAAAGFETLDARVVRLGGRCHVDVGLVVARSSVIAAGE